MWFKKKEYPDFWEAYSNSFDGPQERRFEHLRFVVFDTETTGLNLTKDRILSIGGIGINHLKIDISDQIETYLIQEHFDADTVKIHGLRKNNTLGKITEDLAIKNFLEYIKNSVLVAHHASFDISMINNALKRMNLPKLKNTVIDTGDIYRKTIPSKTYLQHFGLDELSDIFSIPKHDRHTASGDAYITALLFLKLLSKLASNKPLNLNSLQHKRPFKPLF